MKKILALLGSIGMIATASTTLISCGIAAATPDESTKPEPPNIDNTKSNLQVLNNQIKVDFDSEQNSFKHIKQEVNTLVKKLSPKAEFETDYIIEEVHFNDEAKTVKPVYVNVKATDDSTLLTESFNVLIYKDLDRQISDAKIINSGDFDQRIASVGAVETMLHELHQYDLRSHYVIEDDSIGDFPNDDWERIWSVKSVSEHSLVKVNFTFRQNNSIFDLASLQGKIADYKVEEKTYEELVDEIEQLIKTHANPNVEWHDYSINGGLSTGGTVIEVVGGGYSFRLKNKFTINVLKEDITGFKIDIGTFELTTQAEIEAAVAAKFADTFKDKNFNLVLGTDYEIKPFEGDWVEVSALDTSAYLTGSFKFLTRKFYDSFQNTINLNVQLTAPIDEIQKAVIDYMNEELKDSDGNQIQEVDVKEDFRLNANGDIDFTFRWDGPASTKNGNLYFSSSSTSSIFYDRMPFKFRLLTDFSLDISQLKEVSSKIYYGSTDDEDQETRYNNLLNDFVKAVNDKYNKIFPHVFPNFALKNFKVNDTSNKLAQGGTITITPNVAYNMHGTFIINVEEKYDLDDFYNSKSDERSFDLNEVWNLNKYFEEQIPVWIKQTYNKTLEHKLIAGEDFTITRYGAIVNDPEPGDESSQWTPGQYFLSAMDGSKLIQGTLPFTINKVDITKELTYEFNSNLDFYELIKDALSSLSKRFPLTNLRERWDYEFVDWTDRASKPGEFRIISLDISRNIVGTITIYLI